MGNLEERQMLTSSVLIITKDRAEDIEKALHSLSRQTRSVDQLVIVDSGSDRTAESVQAFEKDFAGKVDYLRSEPGMVRQRNVGIPVCDRDVVFMFDSDVELAPECIAKVMAVYEADTDGELAGVAPRVRVRNPPTLLSSLYRFMFLLPRQNGSGRLLPSGLPSFTWYAQTNGIHPVEVFSGCAQSYRLAVLRENLYDEFFYARFYLDDIDYSYRASKLGRLLCEPAAVLMHWEAPSTREAQPTIAEMQVANHAYFFKKHMPSDPFHWLCFLWSDLGISLLRILKRPSPAILAALFRGHLAMLSGKKALG